MTANRTVVYGSYPDAEDDRLVFLLAGTSQDLSQVTDALNAALTWTDFWAMLPPDEREELQENLEWNNVELPSDDTPFDRSLIPGVDDGDYPTYAPSFETEWMPEGIAKEYGVGVDSFVSGSWTEYPPEHEDTIVAELKKLGYVA